MKVNKKIVLGYIGWSGLGFIRGISFYNYFNNKTEKKENYLYVNSLCNGFFGIAIYANPVFFPVLLYKEVYRFEVNARNLKNEKTEKYYELF
jgi:hypothetical protein